ncbi:hypothetical protein A9Q99_12895 [Gammaproteobacteria bacterium 45_16_T64]|nr:hypothetical protein A9Q99_12895 [Gammaproteobacteria bacterium 45_16_T64]
MGFTNDPDNSNPSVELQAWQSTGQFFEFNGHRIFFHDNGNTTKDVVLLMHGFPTSSWDWRHQWQALNEDYHLVSLDMLGFGFSDKPHNKEYSIDEQVELQLALLNKLGINKVNLFVHDYGTYVAQEMLTRANDPTTSHFPISIESLVVLNGPVIPEQLQMRFIQKVFNSPFGWVASTFTNPFMFTRNFSPVFGPNTQPSPDALKDDWYVISQQNGHRLSHKLIHYYNESLQQRERWLKAIRETRIPMLSITGLADPVAGDAMVKKYRELVPSANIIELPYIGHYPHIEAPALVTTHYKQFISSHSNRDTP